MLEATTPKNRARAISHFNLFNYASIFLGGLAGSGLLALFSLFAAGATPFLLLFGLSGILRLAVAVATRPKLRELRFLHIPVRRGYVTSVLTLLPQQGFIYAPVGSRAEAVKTGLAASFWRHREFDDFGSLAVPKRVERRISPRERELLKERYIERAAGTKPPKRARGLTTRKR